MSESDDLQNGNIVHKATVLPSHDVDILSNIEDVSNKKPAGTQKFGYSYRLYSG
jgi:hypothetical protein